MSAVCKSVLDAIPDVEAWNRNLEELKRLAKEHGDECKKIIADEAARRGYLWSRLAKQYVHPWQMIACNHPGRLIGVGFRSGQLAAVFQSKNGPVRYESESHEIDVDTAKKLVRSLYPDKLYRKLIVDKGVQMVRVE